MGNYGIILSLLGCLEHGIKAKKLVDKVIDVCKYLRQQSLCKKLTLHYRRSRSEPPGGNLLEPRSLLTHHCS